MIRPLLFSPLLLSLALANPPHTPPPPQATAPTMQVDDGPWGHLHATPFRLSPSAQVVNRLDEVDCSRWIFGLSSAQVDEVVRRAPLQPGQRALLLSPDLREPAPSGTRATVIHLPDELRLSLSSAARTYFYRILADFEGNVMQTMPYLVPSDERLTAAQISPAVRERLHYLAFQRGDRLVITDFDLVTPLIDDPAELFRLKRLLFGQEALQVELSRDSLQQTDTVQAYWTNRGRRPIAPALRRMLQNPEVASVDLMQILPELPRRLLNTYPDGHNSPAAANCYWTALNFFNSNQTDDRFLPSYGPQDRSLEEATAALARDYEPVAPPYRFGDVICFVASPGGTDAEIVHMLTYVAADIVYSKNGFGAPSPFILTRLDAVQRFYTWVDDLQLRAYRLKRPPE